MNGRACLAHVQTASATFRSLPHVAGQLPPRIRVPSTSTRRGETYNAAFRTTICAGVRSLPPLLPPLLPLSFPPSDHLQKGKLPPPPIQACQKSEKQRSNGLMCLDNPVLARDARYQKNVCRRKLDLTLTTIVATGHYNTMFQHVLEVLTDGQGYQQLWNASFFQPCASS